jgi:hypothetical protein
VIRIGRIRADLLARCVGVVGRPDTAAHDDPHVGRVLANVVDERHRAAVELGQLRGVVPE